MSAKSETKPHPTAKCSECGTRLLTPSESGMCGMCEVELGKRKPI